MPHKNYLRFILHYLGITFTFSFYSNFGNLKNSQKSDPGWLKLFDLEQPILRRYFDASHLHNDNFEKK